MGFLLSFNHSKYINYTYVLINKPLNHFTKIISLVMSEQNLSNLSIKETPKHPSDTHSSPPNATAPPTSTTTPTQIFNTQLYTSITNSPHTSSFISPTRIPPPPPPPSNTITLSHHLTPNSLLHPSQPSTLNPPLPERPTIPTLSVTFTNPSLDTRHPEPPHPLLLPSLSN